MNVLVLVNVDFYSGYVHVYEHVHEGLCLARPPFRRYHVNSIFPICPLRRINS